MATTVVAKMNTCGKTNRVTVSLREDGNLDVNIVSDCKNVQEYAKRLTLITMDDVTSFTGSKVVDPEIRATLSVPCLTPIAVFDAAWQELGMLSKSLCKKVHSNEVILDIDGDQ